MQDMLEKSSTERDASGNPILGDIGQYVAVLLCSSVNVASLAYKVTSLLCRYLGNAIRWHFKKKNEPVDLKYIDPTYMIRAIATIPTDHIYCKVLGQNAVHAAFSGYTGACLRCSAFSFSCCGANQVLVCEPGNPVKYVNIISDW